jgi:integral membrane sensor domain MASE1
VSRAEWLRPRWWTLAALTLVGVFALGATSVRFALPGSTVAPWWPAAGLAVCFLLATDPGPRRSFLFVLGVLVSSAAANVCGGRPPLVSLLYGIANAAEVAVVHGLLTARGRRPRLASMEDLWRLIAATITGAMVIGLLAGLTAHFALAGNFLDSVSAAASSHGAAVLVMAPLGIAAGVRRARRPDVEDLVQWIVVVGVTFWVFHRGQSLPLVFLPIPGLVWGALRLGLRTVAVQLIVVGVLTVRLTIIGGGPFAAAARRSGIRPETVGTLTQAFLVTAAVTALSLAVAATQRRSALAELRAEGELTAGVLDTAASAIIVVDRRGVIERLNATAARLLGGAESELVGRPAADVFPVVDREALAARMGAIADGAVPLAEEHDWDVPGSGCGTLCGPTPTSPMMAVDGPTSSRPAST